MNEFILSIVEPMCASPTLKLELNLNDEGVHICPPSTVLSQLFCFEQWSWIVATNGLELLVQFHLSFQPVNGGADSRCNHPEGT